MPSFNALKIDARLEGVKFTMPANTTTKKYYYFNHEDTSKVILFMGVSLYAFSANQGDTVNLWSEYTYDGGTNWKRYKKFAKNWNVFPNVEMKDLLFPTTPKTGVRLVIEYTNTGGTPVDLALNLYNMVDTILVDPNQLQEGHDW